MLNDIEDFNSNIDLPQQANAYLIISKALQKLEEQTYFNEIFNEISIELNSDKTLDVVTIINKLKDYPELYNEFQKLQNLAKNEEIDPNILINYIYIILQNQVTTDESNTFLNNAASLTSMLIGTVILLMSAIPMLKSTGDEETYFNSLIELCAAFVFFFAAPILKWQIKFK